ncbi:MAG: class I SAM-dependent methyltransferase, partial [Chitinophagaceae bacterium]|nr:class I SAM-dependent methyltransferase [Chitinophagaceae bacterium]
MFETYNYFKQHNDNQKIENYKEFYREFSNKREFGGDFSHLDHLVKNRFMDIWGHVFNIVLRRQPKSILDIGCGLGINLPLANVFNQVDFHGLDYAENTLTKARELYPDVKFHVGDAFNMEFKDSAFEMCILSAVLILYKNASDQENLLNEIRRVMTDDGVLILIVWNDSLLLKASIYLSRFFGKILGQNLPTDFMGVHFKNKEIKQIVKKSGFNVDQVYNTGHIYGVLESVRYLNMSKYNRSFGAAESESTTFISQIVLEDLIKHAGGFCYLTTIFFYIDKLCPSLFSM